MTSHYPDHAFLAGTRAVLMRDGRVMAEGVPGEVVTTESLTALYDVPVEVAEAMAAHEKVKVSSGRSTNATPNCCRLNSSLRAFTTSMSISSFTI